MNTNRLPVPSEMRNTIRIRKKLSYKVSSSVPKQVRMTSVSKLQLPKRQLPAICGVSKGITENNEVTLTPFEQISFRLEELTDRYSPATACDELRVQYLRACRIVLKDGMELVCDHLSKDDHNKDLHKLLSLVWNSHVDSFNDFAAAYDTNVSEMKVKVEQLEDNLRAERYNYLYSLRVLEDMIRKEDDLADQIKKEVSEAEGQHTTRVSNLRTEIGRLEFERNNTTRQLRRLTMEAIDVPKTQKSELEEITRELSDAKVIIASCRSVIRDARNRIDDTDDVTEITCVEDIILPTHTCPIAEIPDKVETGCQVDPSNFLNDSVLSPPGRFSKNESIQDLHTDINDSTKKRVTRQYSAGSRRKLKNQQSSRKVTTIKKRGSNAGSTKGSIRSKDISDSSDETGSPTLRKRSNASAVGSNGSSVNVRRMSSARNRTLVKEMSSNPPSPFPKGKSLRATSPTRKKSCTPTASQQQQQQQEQPQQLRIQLHTDAVDATDDKSSGESEPADTYKDLFDIIARDTNEDIIIDEKDDIPLRGWSNDIIWPGIPLRTHKKIPGISTAFDSILSQRRSVVEEESQTGQQVAESIPNSFLPFFGQHVKSTATCRSMRCWLLPIIEKIILERVAAETEAEQPTVHPPIVEFLYNSFLTTFRDRRVAEAWLSDLFASCKIHMSNNPRVRLFSAFTELDNVLGGDAFSAFIALVIKLLQQSHSSSLVKSLERRNSIDRKSNKKSIQKSISIPTAERLVMDLFGGIVGFEKAMHLKKAVSSIPYADGDTEKCISTDTLLFTVINTWDLVVTQHIIDYMKKVISWLEPDPKGVTRQDYVKLSAVLLSPSYGDQSDVYEVDNPIVDRIFRKSKFVSAQVVTDFILAHASGIPNLRGIKILLATLDTVTPEEVKSGKESRTILL